MLQQRKQKQKEEEEFDTLPLVGGLPPQTAQLHVCGDQLDCLLDVLCSALKRGIGEALDSKSCKEATRKYKAFLCIGVNNVTRTLERMPYVSSNLNVSLEGDNQMQEVSQSVDDKRKGMRKITFLQVVIVAVDVHPRLLVNHFPELAASRRVPLITLSGGNGSGSLRLGELLHLRTAIAVGLKAGDSEMNKAISFFLKDIRGSEIKAK